MKLICTDYNYYSGVKEKQERREFIYKQSNKQTQTKRERERTRHDHSHNGCVLKGKKEWDTNNSSEL